MLLNYLKGLFRSVILNNSKSSFKMGFTSLGGLKVVLRKSKNKVRILPSLGKNSVKFRSKISNKTS